MEGGSAAKAAAVAIPLLLFTILILLGVAGATASVAAYSYRRATWRTHAALDDIGFKQQTIVFDRTGKVELARFGDDRREVVTFDQIPPALIDATTAIEDKDVLGRTRASIPPASSRPHRHPLRPRPRRVDDHAAARARAPPPAAAGSSGTVYDRKIKEIIQSIRLTQAYPGEAGKQAIMSST